ncbi:NADP+-dependent D-mannitol dehydrogenase [Pyrrhoderma noxium]|uniref:NADP+-dependent D-mannitol dehydrogenase n=1 Tax=Pyrrhoderma noxium TaxID=2282107 RepID=A0A286ULK9_9AGAM|nr:NADP+-dependent D-mannitol dehydrogenase [Pyrrhoderma noxium]
MTPTKSLKTSLLTLATLASILTPASSIKINFSNKPSSSSSSTPYTLSSVQGVKDQDGDDIFTYQNWQNASGANIYVATLSVGGKEFPVQLDTGSSDLWLDTTGVDLSGLTDTGVQTGLTYGDGTVAFGPVYFGSVTLGNFTVDQAFISAPGTNATTNSDKGLLGYDGDTLLDNIFSSEPGLPQLTTFSLSRSFSTGKTDGGVFTVGEVEEDFAGVQQAPALPVVSSDRWIVLMDGMIVNGKSYSGDSSFSITNQTSGQTLANLDTGTSLSQIPQSYAAAIYGNVPGAQLYASSGIYVIPCDTKINVSFVFGGIEYPVHPIDTVTATSDGLGGVICFSGFPFSDGFSNSEDFLIGDSFLRNVYSLYDFGAFLNESTTPFIQLLSTTNKDSAYAEFDTLSAERNKSIINDDGGSSSSSGGSGGGGGTSGALGLRDLSYVFVFGIWNMSMKALLYDKPKSFTIANIPIPQYGDDDVLVKVTYCGVCGTDAHIHDGEFIAKFPLVPGHEVVGVITEVGKNVKDFTKGDRCVADNSASCGNCFYCRRGKDLLCENFASKGCTMNGGFAEYVTFHSSKVYKIHNLTDIEATLIEPAACALHGLDKLKSSLPTSTPSSGLEVLLLGSGPTGLILAQLLRLNGATRVVIAANAGPKTRIAREIGAADEVVELDREDPEGQWRRLGEENPRGFDVVIEATGVEKLANDAINYVRRGGVLMMYGVYDNSARVHWPPSKIFQDEILIIGSFAQTYCFPRAVAYLDSGKINVKGMVTDVFALEDFQKALDKMRSRGALKIAIKC